MKKLEQFKILSLEAANIYDNTHYNEHGIQEESKYLIDSIITIKRKDEEIKKINHLFNATMNMSLDLLHFIEIAGDDYKREINIDNHKNIIIPHFINVKFSVGSHEYKKYGNLYIKRGCKGNNDILNDNIYIENDEIIAIKTDEKVTENKITSINPYFKYDDKTCTYKKINTIKGDINIESLREMLYDRKGFSIYLDNKKIDYVRYKRSSSNARNGSCLFINKKYFKEMDDWTYINEEFKNDQIVNNLPVEIEAYKALSLSSIEKTIEYNPNNILVLEDINSIFKTECISATIENGKMITNDNKEVELSNCIWDGEGLLDKSVFDENGYGNKGMMLLRNRYFKSCVFNTNLQKFFKDNNITNIADLNGYTNAKTIEDIKMVVTYSSLKILKFSDAKSSKFVGDEKEINEYIINFWMENVENTFGVVKTDKPTHRFDGTMVRTSYQILNTLGLNENETKELLAPSVEYVNKIKAQSPYFAFYLNNEKTGNYDKRNYFENQKIIFDENNDNVNDEYFKYQFDICSKLLEINNKFDKTRLYSIFRSRTLTSIKNDIKHGRILINGTYATIFGNGYELLLNSIKRFDINSTSPVVGKETVYTKMFSENENIVGMRFPHITMGNFYLAKNIYSPNKHTVYDEYFNLTKEIIVVNSIGENIQQRLNGMDFDSDTLLITNNKIMYNAIKRNYDKFLVPVNMATISKETFNIRSSKSLYVIDDKISNNYIGRIINTSQWLNSIFWDKYNNSQEIDMDLYYKICKLAVLSNMEIDKAKRPYNVNAIKEINSIIKEINPEYNKKPKFMGEIQKDLGHFKSINSDNYKDYNTTMGYVNRTDFIGGRNENKVFVYDIINKIDIANTVAYTKKANEAYDILKKAGDEITSLNKVKSKDKDETKDRRYKIKDILNDAYSLIIKNKYLDNAIAVKILLGKIEGKNKDKIEKIEKYLWPLLYVLYIANENNENGPDKTKCGALFNKIFETTEKPKRLIRDDNGDEELFSKKYRIV